MSWLTPTLDDLVTDTIRSVPGRLEGADAALRANNLRPVAKIIAGARYELHLALANAIDQKFVLTCADAYLDRHGAEMKPPVPRKPAAAAAGQVIATAAGAITLATGAVLTRSDGVGYHVDAGIVMAGAGIATIAVTAVVPGASGNTDAAATLTASGGLTGSATFAVAEGGLGGGADIESPDAYRARLLFSKAYPEHGGAPADWLRYTLAVPGVTRAYIDPLAAGRGTVVVYPLFDLTRANGVPLASDLIGVNMALAAARPGAGLPVVRAASPSPVDVTISGLAPSTPEVEASVAAELAYAFARNGRVAGLSTPHPSMPFLAVPAGFSRSWIWQAVANASGEERHSISVPLSDVALSEGEIAVLGQITFS